MTESPFDIAHKLANDLIRNTEPIRVPFVNYTDGGDCLILALVPGPCPLGYEDKLKSLIDRNVGFKCTVRPGDAAIIIATFLIGDRGETGATTNSCELVMAEGLDTEDDTVETGFQRLIDETTDAIKVH